MTVSYDVVVLGAGFGGSLLSAILSKAGLKVGLIDRHSHPRFAIGESSTPAADFLLHDLAMRYELPELQPMTRFGSWRTEHPEIHCGCKRGFSYFFHGAGAEFEATDDHRCELLVTANASRELADTQWYRPDTDRFFLEVARDHGVTYSDRTDIIGIEHPHTHEWSISMNREGAINTWKTQFVVDASGTAGELLRRLNLEDWSEQLHTHSYSVYGHWNNVRPLEDWLQERRAKRDDYPYPAADSAVHQLFSDGWLWQLRFESGITSLGYVFRGHPAPPQQSADELWNRVTDEHPVLREILGSPSIAEFPGRLFRTGRLQRLWSRGAGDDWAALPFTVGFVDPLHSTGIAHTLSGINRLSGILLEHSGSKQSALLKTYSDDVIEELRHIDRLVSCCYDSLEDFRLFTACSMLYFAAATTFERLWNDNPHQRPGFLYADDEQFIGLIREISEEIHGIHESSRLNGEVTDRLIERIKSAIRPCNHVGLFCPEVPNMYRYTAAEKP